MNEQSLIWTRAVYTVKDTLRAVVGDLRVEPDALIVLIGGNGSGKTSLARALSGELPLFSGSGPRDCRPVRVSFEKQMALLEADYRLRNNDNASEEDARGITPRRILAPCDQEILAGVLPGMRLEGLLDTPLRQLSGGEARKVLLAEALCLKPDLIVFDTPFDALDTETRAELLRLIDRIHTDYHVPTVLIVNRPGEIPATLTAMGVIRDLRIDRLAGRLEMESDPDARILLGQAALPDVSLPPTPSKFALPPLASEVLVSLKEVTVQYRRRVLDRLNFCVKKGQHWQILGPNGAGKSTLLSLITGDNPLTYANDVTVFGFKRGSGESIWDIKKYYGLVSGALHFDYRVSAPALNVVLSGFYDSIGLYRRPSDEETAVARQWLRLALLDSLERRSFRELSFGQQRLLLIIRALVKNPPLLILDEPLQGLDGYARALVKSFIGYIMKNGRTSVLFVSHHPEDAPEGFTHRLTFRRTGDGNYLIEQEELRAAVTRG